MRKHVRKTKLFLVILIIALLCTVSIIWVRAWTSTLESMHPGVCVNKISLWLFPKSCVLWVSTPVSNDVVLTEAGYPIAWNKEGAELFVWKDDGIFALNIADQTLQPASNLLPDTNKRVHCLDWAGRQELFILFQGSVYHFTLATGELKLLSRASISCPSASPDGQFVVFEDVAHNLVIIDRDGLNKQIIFEGDSTTPAWSPDGQRIAFVMDSLPDPAQAEYDIAVVNIDGSGLINLTNTPHSSEYSPTWSPDGQYLAYLSEEPIPSLSLRQFRRVYLYSIKDKAVEPLTNLDYSYSNILWSPEGQWIAASRSLTRYHDARMHTDPRDLKREVVLIPVPEDVLKPSTP